MSITQFFELFNTLVGIVILVVAFDTLVLGSDLLFHWIPDSACRVVVKIIPLYGILIAIGGIGVPLFYEYFFGFPPCDLCWYNRIFSWPALILFVFGVAEKNIQKVSKYIVVFASIATIIGIYHFSTQIGISPSVIPCSATGGGDCSQIDVIVFNFLTIPMMAVITSISIVINTLFWKKNR